MQLGKKIAGAVVATALAVSTGIVVYRNHAPVKLGSPAWTGLLAPARADANWLNAGATISTATNPCPVQPSSNTPAAISAAFTADAGGASYCVINIPAGTFTVSGSFILQYAGKANVILNGAGPNSTFFVWNGGSTTNCVGFGGTMICAWNGDSSINAGSIRMGNGPFTVSGTLTQGSTAITLSGFSNLKVGSEIEIMQNDPSSDNGNAWPCQTSSQTNQCSQQGGAQAPIGKTETQMVTIASCGSSTFGTACSTGSVTITPAIKAPNWSAGNSPVAYWSSSLPLSNVGIQNMSFDVSGISTQFIFQCQQCSNVWGMNLRTVNGTVAGQAAVIHLNAVASNHVTFENDYMYGSNPASEGYGIDFESGTSDSLALNNIGQHVATSYITETGIGNVFAYNEAVDNYFGSGWQQCDELHHAGGDYFTLWEGNVGICAGGDDVHGTHLWNTWYRTYLSGFDPATETGAKYANVQAYTDMAYSRYANIVASVLGTSGKNTTYQIAGASGNPTNCTTAASGNVFQFNYGDQNNRPYNSSACGDSPSGVIDNDPLVASTVMRWGNWDVVHGSVQENAGETGSSAPVYPGLNSPATTFPASFIFTSAPPWWAFPSGSTAPFPAIGPDVTGGNIAGAGGHAWLNPAANCALNVMGINPNGSSGPKPYNPTTCYPTTPATATPVPSPGPGTYAAAQTVSFTSATGGASLFCTTDGSTPTPSSTPYGGPFTVATTETIQCMATAPGLANSGVGGGLYTINIPQCADPAQLSPNFSGSYSSPPTSLPLSIGFSEATAGCAMHMTLDSSAPTCSSTAYAGQNISSTTTMRVIACQAGYTSSTIQGGKWTITAGPPSPTNLQVSIIQ
ncbi:MAG: chitobiase/beta-hexosaminidase C-terminal domain-containing protein [Terracidiphilus sp.]